MVAISANGFKMNKIEYYDEAISFENLYSGLKRSCRNVRWKDSVVSYEANGLKNTYKLRQSLLDGTYKISPYHELTIYEPKVREIVATRIKDRQFQRSLCDNGLYDDITESFILDNPACQKDKGNDVALDRLTEMMRRYYQKHGSKGFFLKCDIHHYFPSTDHQVASEAVHKRLDDIRAAKAVDTIINSFGKDGKGIGLGSQVSQLVELAVLDAMDHYIKEKLHIKYYVRYMDDFVLIHQDKQYLQECRHKIEEFLIPLKLELNKKTTLQPLRSGIRFLKWRFKYSSTGKVLRLMEYNKVIAEQHKLAKLWERERLGTVPSGAAEESLDSWIANAQRGDTFHYKQKVVRYYEQLTGKKYTFKSCKKSKKDL